MPNRSYHKTPSAANELTDEFAQQTWEAERCLIATFWLNPTGGLTAIDALRVGRSHFHYPDHGWLFDYVCACSKEQETPDVGEAVKLAQTDGFDFIDEELYILITETRIFGGMVSFYAETVRGYAKKKRLAIKHLRKISEIIRDHPLLQLLASTDLYTAQAEVRRRVPQLEAASHG